MVPLNKGLSTFDLWYNILKFNTVNNMIANTRVCKYWHQYTTQALSRIQVQLRGKNPPILLLDKQSVHSWFYNILNLEQKNQNKKAAIIFGFSNQINLRLENLNFNLESALPLTLDVWIQECKNFQKNPSFLLRQQWKLEWLTIYFYRFPNQMNARDSHGSCLLHWACQSGYLELVKMLLNYHEIDLHLNGVNQVSTLAFTIQSGNSSIIKLLLEKKASVNQETSGLRINGFLYPLHFAVIANKTEIVQILLDNGANPFLRTNQNENAFDLARNINSILSYKLLIQNFIKLAHKWNIKYTIEIRHRNEKEKLFFVIDESHFYTTPASLGDASF